MNAAGEVFTYLYSGASNKTGWCTNMVLGTNYYQHTLAYDENYTRLAYARGGSNQTYDYYFSTNILW